MAQPEKSAPRRDYRREERNEKEKNQRTQIKTSVSQKVDSLSATSLALKAIARDRMIANTHAQMTFNYDIGLVAADVNSLIQKIAYTMGTTTTVSDVEVQAYLNASADALAYLVAIWRSQNARLIKDGFNTDITTILFAPVEKAATMGSASVVADGSRLGFGIYNNAQWAQDFLAFIHLIRVPQALKNDIIYFMSQVFYDNNGLDDTAAFVTLWPSLVTIFGGGAVDLDDLFDAAITTLEGLILANPELPAILDQLGIPNQPIDFDFTRDLSGQTLNATLDASMSYFLANTALIPDALTANGLVVLMNGSTPFSIESTATLDMITARNIFLYKNMISLVCVSYANLNAGGVRTTVAAPYSPTPAITLDASMGVNWVGGEALIKQRLIEFLENCSISQTLSNIHFPYYWNAVVAYAALAPDVVIFTFIQNALESYNTYDFTVDSVDLAYQIVSAIDVFGASFRQDLSQKLVALSGNNWKIKQ